MDIIMDEKIVANETATKKEFPLIKLLKSPHKHYFYDTNKNQIQEISGGLYRALRNWKITGQSTIDRASLEEMQELSAEGFFANNRVKEIIHPLTPFLQEYQQRKVRDITLQVTQQCNLRCAYCIYSQEKSERQRNHSDARMSYEMAQKAIDFLIEHSVDNEEVYIGFYGGEPLLEFELIRQVVGYAEEVCRGKKIVYAITTNATLITDAIIDFLVEHKFQIIISLDGSEKTHDKNRRFAANGQGTYKTVIKNLRILVGRYPEYQHNLSINMVIDPQEKDDDAGRMFSADDELKKVSISTSVIDDIFSQEKNKYNEDFIADRNYDLFLTFLEYLGISSGKEISPDSKNILIESVKKMQMLGPSERLPEQSAPSGQCLPGITRLLVTTDGTFYPCERVSERSAIMQIGSLATGFDHEKSGRLLNCATITAKMCKGCWAFRLCDVCAKYSEYNGKFDEETRARRCKYTQQACKDKLLDIIMLDEMSGV
ncbi:MAG: radical SAM protein [Lachnospiraceae bacterium]|nr:radical SAM protein [Lachnospiraceae bacterium]